MHTNHNSVCLINIDLIIIFDLFFFISYKNKKNYICLMDFIVYAFILIYLPKYILHNVNIYDLANSPVAYTTLCRIPIEIFICICCSNLIRISNY